MLKIFKIIEDKFKIKKKSEPVMLVNYKPNTEEDRRELKRIYNEYKEKSIKEGRYYLKGSNYMKKLIDEDTPKELMESFYFNWFNKLDNSETILPLDLGLFLEENVYDENNFLGMHKSYAVVKQNVYEDEILNSIMSQGLVNHGSSMQGAIIQGVVSPNKTVTNINDPISASVGLLSNYRDAKGTILLSLPKKYINKQFDFVDPKYKDEIYDYDENGTCYIKPKYILGYVVSENGILTYYSRENLLENYNKKSFS